MLSTENEVLVGLIVPDPENDWSSLLKIIKIFSESEDASLKVWEVRMSLAVYGLVPVSCINYS